MSGNERENGNEPHDCAAPQFSADETRLLFEVLDIKADVADESARARAMERLATLLQDEAQTVRLVAALSSAEPQLDERVRGNDLFEPSRKFHAIRASDSELLGNPATVGKLMVAVEANLRHARIIEGDPSEHPGRVMARGGSMVRAQSPHTPLEESEADTFSHSGNAHDAPVPDVLRHWTKFASEVDHVLKDRETLWGLLSAFFHRTNMISRWEQTEPDWFDLRLQEGRRTWLLRVHFGRDDDYLLLIVSGKSGEPLRMPANNPHEFSKRLIDAFDGDINPARLVLTSVQQAIEASAKASIQ
jgi:hypothetical protein